jgi:hypothetical protein
VAAFTIYLTVNSLARTNGTNETRRSSCGQLLDRRLPNLAERSIALFEGIREGK